MRNAFAKAVTDLAGKNKDLVLLAGDIGNRLFDDYKKKYIDRFYNCGVAEAGMTGIAAGLSSSGLQPITYTITPFNTLRCLEQIKLDICYPNLPVIIVGTGSGLSYSGLGSTHHSLEDIASMRMLPNMHVLCPGDIFEVKLALQKALELKKPCYIRLGKKGEQVVHEEEPEFEIGKATVVKKGSDVAILSVGNMLGPTYNATKILLKKNISSELISFHTIKPIDKELIISLFEKFKLIIVVEEHGLVGGGGSAVLELAHRMNKDTKKLILFNTPDRFLSAIGSQKEARKSLELDEESIALKIIDKLKRL
tara:strand:+ start:763 stop:1689 length:927 start_codon:yes stop_codon:yes gene_type:complete